MKVIIFGIIEYNGTYTGGKDIVVGVFSSVEKVNDYCKANEYVGQAHNNLTRNYLLTDLFQNKKLFTKENEFIRPTNRFSYEYYTKTMEIDVGAKPTDLM